MSQQAFAEFFEHCVGNWSTERTYHYLNQQVVERSHTDFQIQRLTSGIKTKVLNDNQYAIPDNLELLQGFSLAFQTVSETGDRVKQQLNILFVVKSETGSVLEGDYLRDRAYEEDRPIISPFKFDSTSRELLMTTTYTRVVSVDSIMMINPKLRIRRIFNYFKPEPGQPLKDMGLVGFGVEQKVS
ncbi:MAG: phycobiliprotein lyase [Spirulina sp. SIO3F2]|nr:phycobiliprotein lyase [Spirulina sp. SIO3F2]